MERTHEQARTWLRIPREVLEKMCALAQECAAKGKFASARTYFERVLEPYESEGVKA